MNNTAQYSAWRIRRNNDARKLLNGLTPFSPGLSVTQGDFIQSVGLCYQAQNSGTSGASAPTQTTGTYNDGAISWLFFETRALLLQPQPLPTP
jgi:hypothetical protein